MCTVLINNTCAVTILLLSVFISLLYLIRDDATSGKYDPTRYNVLSNVTPAFALNPCSVRSTILLPSLVSETPYALQVSDSNL